MSCVVCFVLLAEVSLHTSQELTNWSEKLRVVKRLTYYYVYVQLLPTRQFLLVEMLYL